MRQMWPVTGEIMRMSAKYPSKDLKGRYHLKDVGVDGTKILTWTMQK
jgi:hypothetical protein